MCGILGFFNFENNLVELKKAMLKIEYRGIDSKGVYFNNQIQIVKNLNDIKEEKTNFILGHLLHAIVDFVPQPITEEKGVLITNSEIYNWEKLNLQFDFKTKNDSETLLKLLNKFGLDKIDRVLNLLDGTYSFCYLDKEKNQIILTRDLLGVKPLFYFYDDETKKFAFASEKKVLEKGAIELEPTKILIYDIDTNKIEFKEKEFYKLGEEHKESYETQRQQTQELLIEAIKKRIPLNQKVGLLFSGGVDSTFIAIVLKKLGVDFTCYTAKALGGNIEEAPDLYYAKRIAKDYNLNLKIAEITTEELEKEVIEIIGLIEDRDYIKVSVALPFHLACRYARNDGVKVIFSGLGSEEIFAGYNRHKKVQDANVECLEGLKILHIRDLYRDDVITMASNIELRLPFLDKELIKYSLNIPIKYKLSEDKVTSKLILRDIAKDLGLADEYAMRQKKAAQYGSKFDKGLLRLAKNKGLGREEYLNTIEVEGVEKVYDFYNDRK